MDNKYKIRGRSKEATVANSSSVGDFICPLCESRFFRKSELQSHFLSHSGLENPFVCNVCEDSFKTQDELRGHYFTHKEEQEYECELCEKIYKKKENFDRHMKTHAAQSRRKHVRNKSDSSSSSLEKGSESPPKGKHIIDGSESPLSPSDDQKAEMLSGETDSQPQQILPLRMPKVLLKIVRTKSNPPPSSCEQDDHTYQAPFKCEECAKVFTERVKYEEHCKSHDKVQKWYRCTECAKKFKSRYLRKKHVRSKHYESTCTVCKTEFRNMKEYLAHMQKAHNKRTFPCTKCSKAYCFSSNLERHLLTHEGQTCKKCKKLFPDEEFEKHECNPCDSQFFCEKCETSFKTEINLKRHLIAHNLKRCWNCCRKFPRETFDDHPCKVEEIQKTHLCDKCPKVFRNALHLRSHYVTVHGEKKHVCSRCDMRFTTGQRLRNHQTVVHENVRNHRCLVCGKGFKMKSALKKHLKIHTGEKPYLCPHCGRGFNVPQNLERHILIHTGEKPHICAYCKRPFRQRWALSEHIRIHTGARPYPCKKCGRDFRTLGYLKVHSCGGSANRRRRWHKRPRLPDGSPVPDEPPLPPQPLQPYSCDVCSREFKEKRLLKMHYMMHNNESGEKGNFVCDRCDIPFKCKRALSTHMRGHRNEGIEYHCDLCLKTFREKYNLEKHRRRCLLARSGEKVHPCGFCKKLFSNKEEYTQHIASHRRTGEKFQCVGPV